MSQWKVPEMNDTSGEDDIHSLIAGNRNALFEGKQKNYKIIHISLK